MILILPNSVSLFSVVTKSTLFLQFRLSLLFFMKPVFLHLCGSRRAFLHPSSFSEPSLADKGHRFCAKEVLLHLGSEHFSVRVPYDIY